MFLRIDGVDGESADAKHKGAIDVLGYDWGLVAPVASRAGGAAAGKVAFEDLRIVARTSKASPTLFLHCASGKVAKEAVLSVRRAGGKQDDYLVVRLKSVRVTSYEQGASDEDDAPLDDLSLAFDRIEVEYRAQDPKGTLGPPVKAGWDVKQNKKV